MTTPAENQALTPGGIAVPPRFDVEAPPEFQGSLVTLFHLARDGRVDLTKVPLHPVCLAYVEYLGDIGFEDVDAAGAALLALSYLVERKAWALLPIADPPPPQEMPELPEPTVHQYALAIDRLEEWHKERSRLFFRPGLAPDDFAEPPVDLGKVTTEHLARVLERLLAKAQPIDVKPIATPRPSMKEVMAGVLTAMKRLAGPAHFEHLLPGVYTRLDAVFVFLAVLELARIGQVQVRIEEDEVCLYLTTAI